MIGSGISETAPVRYGEARSELLARPGRPSAARRRALAGLADDWLVGLFAESGAGELGCALVAVGGYGRGTLVPGSDLDLLLLHPSGTDVRAAADRIWYPVWDEASAKLDHSVRTPAEARRLAGQDIKVVLGILDARTVAGDDALTRSVREAVLADWRALAPNRLDALHRGVLERTERFGELAHLLEPDLKESYGGLRDVTVLRAIEASWVVGTAPQSLESHAETLLDARDGLHQVSKRAADRLTMQDQVAVAALLGDADADVLLRRVSSAGRSIAYGCDVAWHRVERVIAPRRRTVYRRLRTGRGDRTPLADGVVVQEGEAVLSVDARPDRDPSLVLRAAAAAAQAGLRLAPHAVERLAAESAPMPVPWPGAARDALVSLLGAGRSAVGVWEALDQADLISGLIPGWEIVRSAPQRNPVHRFTVDRHLVEAAVQASALTRQVARPDLLLVGALLHDIGKGRPGDHTGVGVELVRQLGPHLGFDADDTGVLTLLVAHHLLLSQTATRRDLDDPATIALVADAVGTTDVLDLLHALTIADALATGPAAWSPWKAGLVRELVARTRGVLAGAPAPAEPLLTPQQRALAAGTGVEVLLDDGPSALTVTVAAPDRVGLLATIAGVLALNRLTVRSASTATVRQRAVTVWAVQPQFGEPPPLERLREDVRRALDGGLALEEKLAARAAAYQRPDAPAPPPPRIDIVRGASDRSTVLEVRAHDEPGLLHTIAHAISAAGVTIDAALVATRGADVIDVFYLRDGQVPLAPAAEASVVSAVTRALSG